MRLRARSRLRRVGTCLLLAVVLVVPATLVPAALLPPAVRAASGCTSWTSVNTPPTVIRVLRTMGPAAGTVQVVSFRAYVEVVMAAEWSSTDPVEALKVGAVAIKEYAWYQTVHWRGGRAEGSCYDVVDSPADQVYAPEREIPSRSEIRAVEMTWGISLRKSGDFFATHYDGGSNVACGVNADGWQLYQVSAMRCAREGMLAGAILQRYYGPDLVIVGGKAASTVSPERPTLSLAAAAITWGQNVRLEVRLVLPRDTVSLARRSVQLQESRNGTAWSTLAELTTNAVGQASFSAQPLTNLDVRVLFQGPSKLGSATSAVRRVLVRQFALLRPDDRGTADHVAAGTAITFTTLVRPAGAGLSNCRVVYRVYLLVGHRWTLKHEAVVPVNRSGDARFVVRFATPGSWYVRAMAMPTRTNANSLWSPVARYLVG